MNRTDRIDSQDWLDAGAPVRDGVRMCHDRLSLYIERREPACNMARFYRLAIETDLFGGVVLVRIWGRIGTAGQRRVEACDGQRAALVLFLALLKRKRARGYRPPRRAT